MAAPSSNLDPGAAGTTRAPFSMARVQLSDDVPLWVNQAQQQLKDRQWTAAHATCQAGLLTHPRDVDGTLCLSEALWEEGQFRAAVDQIRAVMATQPGEARSFGLMARYLLSSGLPGMALPFLERAMQYDPRSSTWKQMEHAARAQLQEHPVRVRNDASRAVALSVHPLNLDNALQAILAQPRMKTGESAAPRSLFLSSLVLILAVVAGLLVGLVVRKTEVEFKSQLPEEKAAQAATRLTWAANEGAQRLLEAGKTDSEGMGRAWLALLRAQQAVDLMGEEADLLAAQRALRGLDATQAVSPPALWARQVLAHEAGVPDLALANQLDEARRNAPDDPWLLMAAGQLAEASDDLSGALGAYRGAYQNGGGQAALWPLARLHLRLGDAPEARVLLDTLLKRDPHHTLGLTTAAWASLRDADWHRQVTDSLTRAQADPATAEAESAWLSAVLAVLDHLEGRHAEAEALWVKAESLVKHRGRAARAVAQVRLAMGQVQRAQQMLEKLAQKSDLDGDVQFQFSRASALAAAGTRFTSRLPKDIKVDAAHGLVRFPAGTLRLVPDRPVPFAVSFDGSLTPEADLLAALASAGDSITNQADYLKSATAVLRAQALMLAGDARDARRVLKERLQAGGQDPDVLLQLARAEAAMGERQDAEKHVRLVLQAQPKSAPALIMLGTLQNNRGDATSALRTMETLLATGQEAPQARVLMARALTQLGRHRDAIAALKLAQEADPESLDLGLMIASAQRADRAPQEAISTYMGLLRKQRAGALASLQTDESATPYVARALCELGEVDPCTRMLKDHLKGHGSHADTLYFLAQALKAQRQGEEAKTLLKQFLAVADALDRRRPEVEKELQPPKPPPKKPPPKKKTRKR